MYRFLLLVGCFCFTLFCKGQIKPKSEDWFAYDLTYASFVDGPSGLTQAPYSNGHSFSFTENVRIGGAMSFGYGIGFHSDNYYNNLLIQTNASDGAESFELINYDTVSTNELTAQYIHIPLELRFMGKANDKGNFFRFTLGFRAGVRINSYSKFKTDNLNVSYNNLGSLNRFDYGTYIRLGFGHINVFSYYGLSPLFTEGVLTLPNTEAFSMDDLRTLHLGISITF
jgi:hypothetical protein